MPWQEPVHHLQEQVHQIQKVLVTLGVFIALLLAALALYVTFQVSSNQHHISTLHKQEQMLCHQLQKQNPGLNCLTKGY